MMREGDKLASYRLIAETLARLSGSWQLDIAGDGPARAAVEALMAPFGARVRFLGQLDAPALAQAYQNASLFLWPGVNEAFGMVYIEAQSHGLPVVAQDRPGVRDVLAPGTLPPAPEAGPAALAQRIEALLADPAARTAQARRTRDWIAASHLAPAASRRFWSAAAPLLEARR
jgi:glycosyltransferase involved in cell wall biosynthesis